MAGSGETPRARPQYFKYKVLEDPELASRRGHTSWAALLAASCTQCSLGSSRCFKTAGFLLTCLASLLRAMAPWVLASVEAGLMLLLYLVLTPHRPKQYRLTSSLDDIVAFSMLRAAAVALAYLFGAGRLYHKPYWHTAVTFCLLGFPFVAVKVAVFHRATRPVPVTLFCLSLAFSLLHVLTAAEVKRWAKKRHDLGLEGYGFPWEGDMEQAKGVTCLGRAARQQDLPATALADPDSLFVSAGDTVVHFKETWPRAGGASAETAVVLVHAFAGGNFAWRLVMQALADRCGRRVVALDRPGSGLTSRPAWGPSLGTPNPYDAPAQAQLLLAFCDALGIKSATLVGHSDGAVPVVLAAAAAARGDCSLLGQIGPIGRSRSASEAEALHVTSSMQPPASQNIGRARSERVRHRSMEAPLLAALAEGGSPVADSRPHTAGSTAWQQAPLPSPWEAEEMGLIPRVQVEAVALCCPALRGEARSALSRLLGNTRVGRRLLRSLLHNEVGLVGHRRAWAHHRPPNASLLDLYRGPHRVHD